jgi:predicted RNA-binding Zn ribbon-like protein
LEIGRSRGQTHGNRLCLDFVNIPYLPGDPRAHTGSWPELVDFMAEKRIVSAGKSEELSALPESDPAAAEILLLQAHRLGEGMRGAFGAMLKNQRVQREWVEPINEILRVTEGHDELEWHVDKWRLGFLAREGGLEWLLAAIARSGAELIAEGTASRLRRCSNPNCCILFCDDSRTHRRRWCSMAHCGNRSKVAAFARRRTMEKARAHHA